MAIYEPGASEAANLLVPEEPEASDRGHAKPIPLADAVALGESAFSLDRFSQKGYVDGLPVRLTAREFNLLTFFVEHRGKVVLRKDVLAGVWGSEYQGGHRTIDVHVRRLRAKLGPSFPLETLRGVGHRLREEPASRGPRSPTDR